MPDNLVVVDVETTGFYKSDRIVEIAIVTLNATTGETIDEYDTLINPQRDVGPTGVHGIHAGMVEAAPTFAESIPSLANILEGGILVCHNLSFDRRMLNQEFERHGVGFDPGEGLCTLKPTRKKLCLACEEFGIDIEQQHRALADARATALLAAKLGFTKHSRRARAIHFNKLPERNMRHTLRRGLADADTSPLNRVVSRARYPEMRDEALQYLDMLDWVLDDGVIDQRERSEMNQLAADLGLSDETRREAHRKYLQCIITAAERDQIISEAEHELISRIASQLEVCDVDIPMVTPLNSPANIGLGTRVCFTGINNKDSLGRLAEKAGMIVVKSVSRRGCDLVVAAHAASQSGKAKTARKWNIPIMSLDEFLGSI